MRCVGWGVTAGRYGRVCARSERAGAAARQQCARVVEYLYGQLRWRDLRKAPRCVLARVVLCYVRGDVVHACVAEINLCNAKQSYAGSGIRQSGGAGRGSGRR